MLCGAAYLPFGELACVGIRVSVEVTLGVNAYKGLLLLLLLFEFFEEVPLLGSHSLFGLGAMALL